MPKALSGYKEINLRALKLLKPGGYLVTCSCSYNVSESRRSPTCSASAAADAQRRCRGRREAHAGPRSPGADDRARDVLPEVLHPPEACLALRRSARAACRALGDRRGGLSLVADEQPDRRRAPAAGRRYRRARRRGAHQRGVAGLLAGVRIRSRSRMAATARHCGRRPRRAAAAPSCRCGRRRGRRRRGRAAAGRWRHGRRRPRSATGTWPSAAQAFTSAGSASRIRAAAASRPSAAASQMLSDAAASARRRASSGCCWYRAERIADRGRACALHLVR